MKLTDGRKTMEITICDWNGNSYGEDWSQEYFSAGSLPYDEETDAYLVPDVDYCVDMAMSEDEEGARCKYDEDGNLIIDGSVIVVATEL